MKIISFRGEIVVWKEFRCCLDDFLNPKMKKIIFKKIRKKIALWVKQ